MNLTKQQMQLKIEELEQELHNSNNSVDYWVEESEKYQNKFVDLKKQIEESPIFSAIKNCSITDIIKIQEFLNSMN